MTPLQQVMPTAVAALLRKAPLCPEKIAFAWRAAVGPAIDKATQVELQVDVLRVRTASASWRREIERSSGLIRSRLAVLLGDDVVRRLDVTVLQRNNR